MLGKTAWASHISYITHHKASAKAPTFQKPMSPSTEGAKEAYLRGVCEAGCPGRAHSTEGHLSGSPSSRTMLRKAEAPSKQTQRLGESGNHNFSFFFFF